MTKEQNHMKIQKLLLAAAFAVMPVLALTTTAAAQDNQTAEECSVGALGGDHTQKNISVSGTTASVKFAVKGDEGCTQAVTFASFIAPNLKGLPLSEQVLHDFVTATYPVGIHEVSVKLPVCDNTNNQVHFFQADLLRGSSPTTALGTVDFATEPGRLIDWKHGGEKCKSKKVVKVVKSNEKVVQAEALPNTGPADFILPAAAVALAAGAGHYVITRRG